MEPMRGGISLARIYHLDLPQETPSIVTIWGLFCSALGLALGAFLLLGALAFFAPRAYADTVYDAGTFEYGGLTYPDNLYGVTVTFNANPSAPDDYMENAGGNIMWYGNRWYPIAGLPPSGSGAGALSYWRSEPSSESNPWYIGVNSTQANNPMNGFYFDANHGWGGYGRTITFGYGADASLPLGSTAYTSELPLLYLHDFVRYVVDNSDFRSRYSFPSDGATIGTASCAVGWFGSNSVMMQYGIRAEFHTPFPAHVVFKYSEDLTSWVTLGNLGSPTATSGDYSQWFWTTTKSGYFMVEAYTANASRPAYTWTSGNVVYDPDSGTGGSTGDDTNTDDIINNALQTLRSIYNGFTSFFDALLGWLPADIRNFFIAIVVVSLVVGLFRIIRGS